MERALRSLSAVFDRHLGWSPERRAVLDALGEVMVGKINAVWHKANLMPPRATLDQRVTWHLAHLKACSCRTTLPDSIVAELKRRGVRIPSGHK